MDIVKAEEYLLDRLENLSDEKIVIDTKLNKIQIEIEETNAKIKELELDVDTAFEIFSPRAKKNDFAKIEIDKLLDRKEELKKSYSDLSEQCQLLEKDINLLKEALGQATIDEATLNNKASNIDTEVTVEEKNYGKQILEQQENERSRIARDLHDSVVQVLTNLVHKSEICTKIVDVDTIRTKLELEIMAKTLRETIEEMRNIIYNLRPMSFDDLGLNVTLERCIKSLNEKTDMNVTLEIQGERGNISNIVELTLFRIVQECTSNSIKYSNGSNIKICVIYDTDNVSLEITDDGKGFDTSKVKEVNNNYSGFGLEMMKERVSLLSGKISIESWEGAGTKIVVVIPMG